MSEMLLQLELVCGKIVLHGAAATLPNRRENKVNSCLPKNLQRSDRLHVKTMCKHRESLDVVTVLVPKFRVEMGTYVCKVPNTYLKFVKRKLNSRASAIPSQERTGVK